MQNGGGSTIFVEWKRGGEIILCKQKEKMKRLKMPCTIYKCIFMSKFKKIILFNRLNT